MRPWPAAIRGCLKRTPSVEPISHVGVLCDADPYCPHPYAPNYVQVELYLVRPLIVLGSSLNELQDRCKASKIHQDADGSRTITQTAEESPTSSSPSPRKTGERPPRVRA